jgi:transcriptional regulator with XRE-family HTH domain
MNLQSIGALIAERRRGRGLTLSQLAARARVGRSTLAALESGKLAELGLGRVARICEALDLVLEARPLRLEAPLMAHRHLTDAAGRDLSKAAIDDIITRGDIAAWRGLVAAMRADASGSVARRVREVARVAASHEPRGRAFARLLPSLLGRVRGDGGSRGARP